METFSCLQIILQLFTKQGDGKELTFVCLIQEDGTNLPWKMVSTLLVEKSKENR